MNCQKERYQLYILRVLLVLLSLITLYFAFVYFFPTFFDITGKVLGVFFPFIVAIIVAILIDPIVDWLELVKGLKRGTAVAISLLVVLSLVILLMIVVTYRLVIELTELYQQIPVYTQLISQQGLERLQDIRNFISNNPLPLEAQEALQQSLQGNLKKLAAFIARASDWLFRFLTGLPGIISVIVVAGLGTYFVSRDKKLITSALYRLMPSKMIQPSSSVVGEVSNALVGFFRAQLILLALTTVLTVLGVTFLGFDYGLTIGIIVGLLDVLPVIGPGALFVTWAIILILLKEIRLGIGLLILFLIITGVRQLLESKILSKHIGLHPLVTIIALYLGLQLMGIWGIIIGPFLVIILKAVWRTFWLEG